MSNPPASKVYGWTAFAPPNLNFSQRQVRAIVAAKSLAAASRASEACGLGKIYRDFCSPTGNEQELLTALANPGLVFARDLDAHRDTFRALRPRQNDTAEPMLK